ncbi:MAG TPA: Rap1a/Tai family immunity protein [Acetobacteraceae bacterium]|nr:Rap1a/Tai family immunity protein [Acetobacteraceae bacterium]
MLASPAPARAQVSEQTFRGGRSSDLATLCAADPASEGGVAARAWCHGFIIGAGQYHSSLAAADPGRERLFCLPETTPTLDQVRSDFVAWARANPQYGSEKAVDALMRFAVATWPCPPTATRPSTSRR